jgi:hypothetical protein
MIELNAPTHEFKKSNFGDKKESNMFSGINQNREVLFVQVNHGCGQFHKPFRSVK